MNDMILKSEEKAVFALRSLYSSYGYLPFKMSKFEEYDIYVQNKDFLVSDRVITFNDTNGKLLALKPDVTLSIIKNTTDEAGCKQKVYYNENVYRVSHSTHQFKEIMQAGLECIGDIDTYDIFEAVYLAAKSLDTVSHDFVLDISHMGIVSSILSTVDGNSDFKDEAVKLISERNSHEMRALCGKYELENDTADNICALVNMYGSMSDVLYRLEKVCVTEESKKELSDLEALCKLLMNTEYADKIRIDFSVLNDMSYYNGIVFKGFLNGIFDSVLSGGRYDKLLHRMGRRSGAVGFALYLDLLSELNNDKRLYDVDTLVVYGEDTDTSLVFATVNKLTGDGKTVSAQKGIPSKLRYRKIVDLCKEEK